MGFPISLKSILFIYAFNFILESKFYKVFRIDLSQEKKNMEINNNPDFILILLNYRLRKQKQPPYNIQIPIQ